jgi:hypothetical protein
MSKFDQYMAYIDNTGGSPTIEQFDDDWEPIGPMLRAEMKAENLIVEIDGKVKIA